jgi:hypothetical protein
MFKTALLAAALVVAVALISPQQIGVIIYKITLVTLAGVAGYALDRALFPYARPHKYEVEYPADGPGDEHGIPPSGWVPFLVTQTRRALIVAAAMLATGLGL